LPDALQVSDGDGVGEIIGDAAPSMPEEPLFAPELPTGGARPPAINIVDEPIEVPRPRRVTPEPSPEPKTVSEAVKENKTERSSIASFFGFGSRSSEPESPQAETPREPGPVKKGWWQKK
jgi:hypothetical protein